MRKLIIISLITCTLNIGIAHAIPDKTLPINISISPQNTATLQMSDYIYSDLVNTIECDIEPTTEPNNNSYVIALTSSWYYWGSTYPGTINVYLDGKKIDGNMIHLHAGKNHLKIQGVTSRYQLTFKNQEPTSVIQLNSCIARATG